MARTADYDVAVVGGGPSGCAAGVYAARYDLDTVVFDRGRSSLRRCAFLENHLGFPAGIDIETFYALMHDHITEAGCDLIDDLVTSVTDAPHGFRVESEDGRSVSATRVVAATKYGAPYLEGIDDGTLGRKSAADEWSLDRSLLGWDGQTSIDGLYVAGPLAGVGDQVLIAAGHGAHVGRTLITDIRRADGYWDEIAEHYDWVRREVELTDEWRERDRWDEWFESHDVPDHLSDERIEELRSAYLDARFQKYIEEHEIEARTRRAHRRLADHLEDDVLLESIDDDMLLEAIDDDRLEAYVQAMENPTPGSES